MSTGAADVPQLPYGDQLPELTALELDVLRAAAAGLTHAETAARLGYSPVYVRRIERQLRDTFGARSRPQLAALAVGYGLVRVH